MGIKNVITIKCDYEFCKNSGQNTPAVLQWNLTDVEQGVAKQPEEASKFVILTTGGKQYSFCCALHVAEHFVPKTHTIIRTETASPKVIEMPKSEVFNGNGDVNG